MKTVAGALVALAASQGAAAANVVMFPASGVQDTAYANLLDHVSPSGDGKGSLCLAHSEEGLDSLMSTGGFEKCSEVMPQGILGQIITDTSSGSSFVRGCTFQGTIRRIIFHACNGRRRDTRWDFLHGSVCSV